MTVEPQPAGPTFARSARVNGTCTTYERIYIYIYIYIKNIYIYIYDEDFSQLYDKCGARVARQLYIYIYDEDFSQLYDKCGARAARQLNNDIRGISIFLNDLECSLSNVCYIL